jgi:hypothetical protein
VSAVEGGKTRWGGMFSPSVRVSFAIFRLRAGAMLVGVSMLTAVGLSGERGPLGVVSGTAVVGDSMLRSPSVEDMAAGWRWRRRGRCFLVRVNGFPNFGRPWEGGWWERESGVWG